MSDRHESQLRALMEALPFASWFKDENGNFNQVNGRLLAMLEKEAQEVLGKGSRELFGKAEAEESEGTNGKNIASAEAVGPT